MIDKRITRSQNYKQFKLQQKPSSSVMSFHRPNSIFHLLIQHSAIFTNCWKLRIYICVLLIHQSAGHCFIFFNSLSNLQLIQHWLLPTMRFKVQTIKPTMIEQIPSTLQSSDCNFSTILVPSTDSTFCSAQVLHETISSLLDQYSDQLELNCSLLEQNLQLSSQFHVLKENLAICEHHNLQLSADNH